MRSKTKLAQTLQEVRLESGSYKVNHDPLKELLLIILSFKQETVEEVVIGLSTETDLIS